MKSYTMTITQQLSLRRKMFSKRRHRNIFQKALQQLKRGKISANDGLVADMLKRGHTKLICILAEFFSQIVGGALQPPVECTITKFRVVLKKGDPALRKNYMPIAMLPVKTNFV
eukprot:5598970-Pyramimonas_sp.AAC.1